MHVRDVCVRIPVRNIVVQFAIYTLHYYTSNNNNNNMSKTEMRMRRQ